MTIVLLPFCTQTVAFVPIIEPRPLKPPTTFSAILDWTEDSCDILDDTESFLNVASSTTGRFLHATPEEVIRRYCRPAQNPLFVGCQCVACTQTMPAKVTQWEPPQASVPSTEIGCYPEKKAWSGEEAFSTKRWIPGGVQRSIWGDGDSLWSSTQAQAVQGLAPTTALLFQGLFNDYTRPPPNVALESVEYNSEHAGQTRQVDSVLSPQVSAGDRSDATKRRVRGRLDDQEMTRLLRKIWERT
ncbi:hypothetical protein BC628DRAFT_821674 [Trametes gibbosa]|nr:hypothetical protein BC628DRAFT_821674 [Trametes gibbosa]